MGKNVVSPVRIMVSVFGVLGCYLIYVWFRLQSFKAFVDYSLYVPNKQFHLRPEVEIQLYCMGFVVILLFSPVVFFLIKRLKFPAVLSKLFSFIALAGLIIATSLVAKSLILNSYLSSPSATQLFKENSYVFFSGLTRPEFLLVFATTLTLFLVWIRHPGESVIFSKLNLLILLIIILSISVFTPFVRGVDGGPYYNYYYLVGPINDILHGKTLLVDAVSQYGLLSIYFLALPFKFLVPLTFDNFFWMYYFVTCGGYFLAYLIMRRLIGGFLLPALGLFLILQQNYYLQVDSLLSYPQTGFLRFGWWLIVAYYLTRSSSRFLVEIVLVSIATFWMSDAGIYVMGAYLSTMVFREIMKRESIKSTIRNIVSRLALICICLLLFLALISTFTLIRSGFLPNWHFFTGEASLFIGGFGLLPMAAIGPHLFFPALYLIILIYILYLMFVSGKKTEANDQISVLVFIEVFGILQFIYYVGRSHPNNLHHVVIPFIILFCWIIKKAVEFVRYYHLDLKLRVFVFFGFLLTLLIFSAIVGAGLKNMAGLYSSRSSGFPELDKLKDDSGYGQSINAIKEDLGGLKGNYRKIAILSKDETFFLVYADSANIINSNNISYFSLMSDLEKLGLQLLKERPEVIYIDHNNNIDQVEIVKRMIEQDYAIKENVGVLDVWQRKE